MSIEASGHRIKVRPTSSLGAYARSGFATAGAPATPSGRAARLGPYSARPAASPPGGVAAAPPGSPAAGGLGGRPRASETPAAG
eukprot:2185376-Alexandrium_andersonii.AAC.1